MIYVTGASVFIFGPKHAFAAEKRGGREKARAVAICGYAHNDNDCTQHTVGIREKGRGAKDRTTFQTSTTFGLVSIRDITQTQCCHCPCLRPCVAAYLIQLVVQLWQGGSDEFLPQRRCRLAVKINVWHGIDGVVSKSPQVIGVGVGIVVVVMLAPCGWMQARLTHYGVSVLQPFIRRSLRRGRVTGCVRIREIHNPKPAFGFLSPSSWIGALIILGGAGSGFAVAGWGSGRDIRARWLVLCGTSRLSHKVHLEAALTRRRTERPLSRIRGKKIVFGRRGWRRHGSKHQWK